MAIDNKIHRVGIYARVSSQEQVTEGVSIEAQIAALSAYAKSQGWEIADEYIEWRIQRRHRRQACIQTPAS